jgi:hypothetical protein
MNIDVVIPCYNYGRYLRQCVESVLDQDGVNVRALIIDDCSTDDTPEIGRTLSIDDPRVEYRRHAMNLRHIATYNEGFEWVTADAALLLSADDLVTPGALTRAASVFERHPEVSLVWGRQIVCDDKVPPAPRVDDWSFEVIPGAAMIDQMCRTASNPVATPSAVVRTSVLKAIGGYDSSLPHTADMLFWLRCAARGPVARIDADQAYKRMHGQNMQVEFVDRVLPDLRQRLAAVEAFAANDGHLSNDSTNLVAMARKAVASEAFWAASRAFDRGEGEQCDQLLAAASQWDASLPSSRAWSRLTWKRRLGSHFWQGIRPIIDRFRVHAAVA